MHQSKLRMCFHTDSRRGVHVHVQYNNNTISWSREPLYVRKNNEINLIYFHVYVLLKTELDINHYLVRFEYLSPNM